MLKKSIFNVLSTSFSRFADGNSKENSQYAEEGRSLP
jgi:hypothetical protein